MSCASLVTIVWVAVIAARVLCLPARFQTLTDGENLSGLEPDDYVRQDKPL
jgi:hypothetical protein